MKGFTWKNKTRGVLFVEAALVIPFFLFLLVNAIYFSLLLHDYLGLNNLTRDATRYAAVEKSGLTESDKTASVSAYLTANANNYLIHYNYTYQAGDITFPTDAVTGEKCVRVQATATRVDDLPLLVNSFVPTTITGSLRMRWEGAQ